MTGGVSAVLQSLDRRRILNVLGVVVLTAVVGVFLASAVPQTVGADHSYVVLSDSMSPTIEAGAVVFVSDAPVESIEEGDVITFQSNRESGAPVTHRVVDVLSEGEQPSFITKGDANEDPDPSAVAASAVIGTVVFHIPLIGYVVSFANSQLGLLTLIVLPALLLVVLELRDIWRVMAEDRDDQSEGGGRL